MTAISYLGISNSTSGTGPHSVAIPAGSNRVALWVYCAETVGSVTVNSVIYDASGANSALTQVMRYVVGNRMIEVWQLPEALIQASSLPFSWSLTGTLVAGRASIVTFGGVDQTTPINGSAGAAIVASTTGSVSVTSNTDGGVLAACVVNLSTTTADWSSNAFNERVDGVMATSAARSIATKVATGTISADVTLSASDSGLIAAVAINAAGFAATIDITAVNSGSAMTEGQTGVAIVGTALNAAGAGARARIVSEPSTFQALSNYSPSSATAATADVPTLTSLPFSQTAAGVGLPTWNLEVIGTASGTNDGSPVAIEIRPQAGYDVVEIAAPDLTSESLLSAVGWTAVATDLIEWDTSVTVDGAVVTVTVNDDGTVSLDSTPDPLPASVSFQWRAYSSADNLWTSYATATFGDEEAATDDEFLFRRHRYLAFQRVGRFSR